MAQYDHTYADYRGHVEYLAAQHGITIEECATCGQGFAEPDQNRIHVPVLETPHAYAIALHELGHLIEPVAFTLAVTPKLRFYNALLRDYTNLPAEVVEAVIEVETIAWQWARDTALWWGPEEETIAVAALGSYEARRT